MRARDLPARGSDALTIGAEGHRVNETVVPLQAEDQSAIARIPQHHLSVKGIASDRDQALAVRAEGDVLEHPAMPLQAEKVGLRGILLLPVPDHQAGLERIATCQREAPAIGTESQTAGLVVDLGQDARRPGGLCQVPDLYRSIHSGGGEEAAVGCEGHTRDAARVGTA